MYSFGKCVFIVIALFKEISYSDEYPPQNRPTIFMLQLFSTKLEIRFT